MIKNAMSKDEFGEKLIQELEKILGDEVKISTTQVVKNNGVVYNGLVFQGHEANIAPNLYYDEAYSAYLQGIAIDKIIVSFKDSYIQCLRDAKKYDVSKEELFDYEKIKDRICIKIINYEQNLNMLVDIPHTRLLDLVIIYCVSLEQATKTSVSVRINHFMLNQWNISQEELHEVAIRNHKELFKFTFTPMEEIIDMLSWPVDKVTEYDHKYLNSQIISSDEDDKCGILINKCTSLSTLHIATNDAYMYGATILAYKDLLFEITKIIDDSLIILPSSVHEVIIIGSKQGFEYSYLINMVAEVNITKVAVEEVLSYSIYRFDRETKELERLLLDEEGNNSKTD